MNPVDEITQTIDKVLKPIFSDKVSAAVITLFLVLYGGLAAPKLPKSIANLFKSKLFKLIILTFVAYTASKNASIAIITAVALVISMQTLSKYDRSDVVIQELEEKESEEEPITEESEVNVEEEEESVESENVESEQVVGIQQIEEEKYASYGSENKEDSNQESEEEYTQESEEELNTSEEDRVVRAQAEQEIEEESDKSETSVKVEKVAPTSGVIGYDVDDTYASY